VEQLRGAVTGTVTAGLSIAAHLALLPGTLKPFRLRYPQAKLHIIEGFYPTLELGLRTGAIDFYLGVDPGQRLPAELTREVLFENRRIILGRAGHPLAAERTLSGLSDAEWATTSIMLEDEDEIGLVFAQHGLPCPKLVLRAQSALTLMTCLLQSDLLAMVPVQWNEFPLTRGSLMEIQVREELAAPPMVVIQRSDLPLTPVATYLLDLLRRARSAPSGRDRISRA
jgi:DNA-binding transcriptional LysR family regulator